MYTKFNVELKTLSDQSGRIFAKIYARNPNVSEPFGSHVPIIKRNLNHRSMVELGRIEFR